MTSVRSPLTARIADNYNLRLGANNILDKDPPFARVSTNQIFDSANASVLGRMVSVELRKKF